MGSGEYAVPRPDAEPYWCEECQTSEVVHYGNCEASKYWRNQRLGIMRMGLEASKQSGFSSKVQDICIGAGLCAFIASQIGLLVLWGMGQ